ncbi:MAG: hypothetical protein U1E76_17240 [Planctomycetota bacterium]
MHRYHARLLVPLFLALPAVPVLARGHDPAVFMDVVVAPHVVPQGGAIHVTLAFLNLEQGPLDGQWWGAILHDDDVVAKFPPERVHLPPQQLITIDKVLPVPPDAARGGYALVAEVGERPGRAWARAGDRFLVVGPVDLHADVLHDRVPADRPVPIDALLHNNTDRELDLVLYGKLDHDHDTVVTIAPLPVHLARFERRTIHLEIALPDHPPLGDYVLLLFAGASPHHRPWARAADRFEVIAPH